jgi:hypothetical protein
MKEEFEVNSFMIMKFDIREDSLLQNQVTMSLENCRLRIAKLRKDYPEDEYWIVAVLDE